MFFSGATSIIILYIFNFFKLCMFLIFGRYLFMPFRFFVFLGFCNYISFFLVFSPFSIVFCYNIELLNIYILSVRIVLRIVLTYCQLSGIIFFARRAECGCRLIQYRKAVMLMINSLIIIIILLFTALSFTSILSFALILYIIICK